MSDLKPELKTCSRCHSKLLLQYFSTNRQGELYKLCNNCRVPPDQHKLDETKKERLTKLLKQQEEKKERIDNILKRTCTQCNGMHDMIKGFGLNRKGGVYRICKDCRLNSD